jgi:hypothetical protein
MVIRSFSLTCLLTFSVIGQTSIVQFNGPTAFPVGTTPNAVVAMDLNGDGKIDIAVAHQSGTLRYDPDLRRNL